VILREIFGEELERYAAAEARVFRLVDDTHASATELAQDAVVRNQLVDQWARWRRWDPRVIRGGESITDNRHFPNNPIVESVYLRAVVINPDYPDPDAGYLLLHPVWVAPA